MSEKEKGFVTIAVGDYKYYQMALNLLLSYRRFCIDPMPFAIIADCENEITAQFDDVVLIAAPQKSYMVKIDLPLNSPYDENIFIDADCLAYNDLNVLWSLFRDADDFSSIGEVYSTDTKGKGWFDIEGVGDYADKIHFITHLHGGVYFIRRGKNCKMIHDTCIDIIQNYDSLHFSSFNDKPADEPVFALAMALHNLKPKEYPPEFFCFYPCTSYFESDIDKGKVIFEVPWVKKRVNNGICVHWGNFNIDKPIYRIEVYKLRRLLQNKRNNPWVIKIVYIIFAWSSIKATCLNKIRRICKRLF